MDWIVSPRVPDGGERRSDLHTTYNASAMSSAPQVKTTQTRVFERIRSSQAMQRYNRRQASAAR